MNIDDLFKIVLVSDPKVHPNGLYLAYTVTKMDKEKDDYISNIWLMDLKTRERWQFTNGGKDKFPEWSPKGDKIAFVSRRTLKKDEMGAELWVKGIEFPEERLIIVEKGGVQNISWNHKGDKLIYISSVGEIDEDVKVIENIPFWFNGKGFVYNRYDHLFLIDLDSGYREQLTHGDVNVIFAQWSPVANKIAYILQEDPLKPYISNIYVLDLERNERVKLTTDNFNIVSLTWDPKGEKIAFKATDLSRGYSTHYKLWVVNVETKDIIPLAQQIDKDLVNPANSDVRGPSSSKTIQWIDNYIYLHLAEGGAVHLYRVDIRGKFEPVITGDRVVEDFTIQRGGRIYLTIMDPLNPPEIYMYERGNIVKLTHYNDHFLSKKKLSKPEKFAFEASDGTRIEGWIMKPIDFSEGEKYPTILEIHGGPMTTYGYGFMHEFHVLTSKGFVVVYMNPRGSSGYSEEFKDIRGKYGERDYKDLMEGLNYVLEKFQFVDKERLGVTGGSYGGFMTNWIITQTDIFKAAVTQRSISNWISFYGTTDIGFHFAPDQMGRSFDAHFWTDETVYQNYWEKSPIKHIKNVKTPLLIIHSEQDYRCWLDQALQIYTALKIRGVETRMVIFPKENHDLSRSGKPKHRAKRLKEIVNWFKKHLKEG